MRVFTRWDPFSDLFAAHTLLDWLIDGTAWPRAAGRPSDIVVDVDEDAEGYTLRSVLPGIRPDDLEVTLAGQTLTIRGEFREPELPQGTRYHLRERPTGRFERSVRFPLPLNVDAVQSQYVDGVLMVRVPKAEAFRPRRIAVQSQPALIEGRATPALEQKEVAAA
ncbi:MAG TPA: Hsp20/alpha crystallin family protein [Roseiflexaceae bacterium]|nr:Hsp20/alpha crystallin family protein [Roseiflexaceae bacterium]